MTVSMSKWMGNSTGKVTEDTGGEEEAPGSAIGLGSSEIHVGSDEQGPSAPPFTNLEESLTAELHSALELR